MFHGPFHFLAVQVPSAESPVCRLECAKAFAGLSPRERQYALALSDAAWAGAPICLLLRRL